MVLLDTCTLLWLVAAPERFSGIAKGLIEGATEAFVSAISAFEIGIKHSRGALATAQEKGWALLTPDPLIGEYPDILIRW